MAPIQLPAAAIPLILDLITPVLLVKGLDGDRLAIESLAIESLAKPLKFYPAGPLTFIQVLVCERLGGCKHGQLKFGGPTDWWA